MTYAFLSLDYAGLLAYSPSPTHFCGKTERQDQSRGKIIPEKGRLDFDLDRAAGLVALQSQPENCYRQKEKDHGADQEFRQSLPCECADELCGYRTNERGRDHREQDQFCVIVEQSNGINPERNEGVDRQVRKIGNDSHPERETLHQNKKGCKDGSRQKCRENEAQEPIPRISTR